MYIYIYIHTCLYTHLWRRIGHIVYPVSMTFYDHFYYSGIIGKKRYHCITLRIWTTFFPVILGYNSNVQFLLIRHRMKHSTGVLALLAMRPPSITSSKHVQSNPQKRPESLKAGKNNGKHHKVPPWFHLHWGSFTTAETLWETNVDVEKLWFPQENNLLPWWVLHIHVRLIISYNMRFS